MPGGKADLRTRLTRLLAYYGESASAFADRCGLSHATISTAIQRNGYLIPETVQKIVDATGCSWQWLNTGTGDWGLGRSGPSQPPDPHGGGPTRYQGGGQDLADRTAPRQPAPSLSQTRIRRKAK